MKHRMAIKYHGINEKQGMAGKGGKKQRAARVSNRAAAGMANQARV